jgi:hypothetical protein
MQLFTILTNMQSKYFPAKKTKQSSTTKYYHFHHKIRTTNNHNQRKTKHKKLQKQNQRERRRKKNWPELGKLQTTRTHHTNQNQCTKKIEERKRWKTRTIADRRRRTSLSQYLLPSPVRHHPLPLTGHISFSFSRASGFFLS